MHFWRDWVYVNLEKVVMEVVEMPLPLRQDLKQRGPLEVADVV